MYGEHTYEETSEGLKITVTMSMSGPLAFLWNRLVMKDIVSHLPQDIDQHIKAAQKL